MQSMQKSRLLRWAIALLVCATFVFVGMFTALGETDDAADDTAAAPEVTATVDASADSSDGEAVADATTTGAEDVAEQETLDLTDAEAAQSYIDGYADNVKDDPDFKTNIDTALETVRKDTPKYATWWALIPPVIAIVLALITKEVYSSLFIGIVCGGLIFANFNLEATMNHVISDGFIANIADSYNIGILIFLVLLGALVAMMNKAGGSQAFGRWASKHIKTRVGAQLATIILGVLIFIDDYFNCLTVGSVMRPVTDKHNISRAKLSYLIDATAAPICIIAPISSWAAAVAGFAADTGTKEGGMELFLKAIPYNFYAILTIVMMIYLAVSKMDYGPMKKHELNALNGDIFTSGSAQASDEEVVDNPKGKVWDLILPVIVLIVASVFGMIYSGGFFASGEDKVGFIEAFSNSDASVGLVIGAFIAIIFTVIYYLCRRVLKFGDLMSAIPDGFKAMVPAILILCCAWTLKAMTDSLGAKIFISQLIEGSADSLKLILPAIIFLIAVALSFSTGTSWGTFGILIPIVISVFSANGGEIMIIAISACMAGAVCGDHCSPISDTTIMASAGGQCNHINHVSTQLPYALTVAGVSFVSYIIAGFVKSWLISLPIAIVLMIGTLFVINIVTKKKA